MTQKTANHVFSEGFKQTVNRIMAIYDDLIENEERRKRQGLPMPSAKYAELLDIYGIEHKYGKQTNVIPINKNRREGKVIPFGR